MAGWVKVISEAKKNRTEPRRPSPHEYRKCRELRTTRLQTTKRRVRNRNPLKKNVYRIEAEGNSCILAEKFSFLRRRKKDLLSEIILKEIVKKVTIVPLEKK